MPTEAIIITEFEGMVRGRRTAQARSLRRNLDTPYDLTNLLIDENGHLWLPRAHDAILHNFAGTGRIRKISNITAPDSAILVQVDQALYALNTTAAGPYTPVLLVSNLGDETPVWVNSFQDLDYTLVGNETNTWKITSISAAATAVATTHGFASYVYKGRRWVAVRGSELIHYSDLNTPETFGADSSFAVGGDYLGGDWSEDPGSPTGFAELGDNLVIFMSQAIYLLGGTDPDRMQLNRTNSMVGCWARETIVQTEHGIMFFGGTPRNEFGIYSFTGSQSELVSAPVSAFFRRWEQLHDTTLNSIFQYANKFFHCFRWNDILIFSAEGMRAVEGDIHDVFIYDLVRQTWTTFGGWANGPRVGGVREFGKADALLVTEGDQLRTTVYPLCRASNVNGTAILGWHDEQDPYGFRRFIGVKIYAWKSAISVGNPTITVKASTPDADPLMSGPDPREVTSGPVSVPFVQYANTPASPLVFPINLRGQSIRLTITVDPSDPTDEVLIESVQLIYSGKGQKLSRH